MLVTGVKLKQEFGLGMGRSIFMYLRHHLFTEQTTKEIITGGNKYSNHPVTMFVPCWELHEVLDFLHTHKFKDTRLRWRGSLYEIIGRLEQWEDI